MLKHSRIRNSVKLITDKTGAVTGVLVKGKHSGLYQINAKAVVLATGGIGANAKLENIKPARHYGAATHFSLATAFAHHFRTVETGTRVNSLILRQEPPSARIFRTFSRNSSE